jgi:lysophospholipid acyltransferase
MGLFWTMKIKYFLSCWNISVHEWLKNYVFMRMLPTGSRGKGIAKASFLTMMVSAIWHGFYPGFFFFFLGAFIMDFH